MKNIYYAIISTLLVTAILFSIYYSVDLFRENVTESLIYRKKQRREIKPVKSRQQAKRQAKPIRQLAKRQEKQVCIGKNCNQWSKTKDITDEIPETKMDDMKYAMQYDKA